jgi:hypothetical protein
MILRNIQFLAIAMLIGGLVLSSCKKNEDEDTENPPAAPVVRDALHVYGDYFYVNWIGVTGAEKYFVDVATDQGFSNILADYNNKEVAINGMFIVEGLNTTTDYFVRMRSYNANGASGNSAVKQYTTRAANVLPNMGMEDWIDYPNYESPAPEGVWASANKVVDLNPDIYPQLLFRTDDAHSGSYAARAVTNIAIGMPLLTGSLSTGLFDVNLDNPLKSMIIGVPYKSRPTRFQGYYKYFPGLDDATQGLDSCEIRTSLTRWNFNTNEREKVGEAIMRKQDTIVGPNGEYVFFDLEFEYFLTGYPDTIDMVFAASAGGEYFKGVVGSAIFVDDFTLIFE